MAFNIKGRLSFEHIFTPSSTEVPSLHFPARS